MNVGLSKILCIAVRTTTRSDHTMPVILQVPGLDWKLWIQATNGETRGGIYLFDTLENARDWGEQQLRPRLESGGAREISLSFFDVNEAPSRITRGPLDTRVAVSA
jgi:hypothetical protein